jgi:hypothetical protein
MHSIIARAGLTAIFVIGASSASSAKSLTPEQIAALDAIKSDPEATQQAQSRLGLPSKLGIASAQSKSKIKATQTKKSSTAGPASKEPDQITKLIQANEHKEPSERQYSPCAGWSFILRQDWKDLGNAAGAACPGPATMAQGAQISFANDLAAHNRIATINGTAALLFNSITGDVPPPTPYALSFGAYTTVDNVSNSAASQLKNNVDTLAYGGLVNLGFANSVGANYFMLRGGAVDDFGKNTTAANAVVDWSPVVYPLYIHYPYHFESLGIPIITRFDSDLVARFDSATGKDALGKNQVLAFNNMQNALRLGPELALTILPDPGYVTGPVSRLSALFGYDIWYETYSRKQLTWFTSSVNYNIDEAGNFGIKGTYNSGQNVNTGKGTNIYTIGLSAKI